MNHRKSRRLLRFILRVASIIRCNNNSNSSSIRSHHILLLCLHCHCTIANPCLLQSMDFNTSNTIYSNHTTYHQYQTLTQWTSLKFPNSHNKANRAIDLTTRITVWMQVSMAFYLMPIATLVTVVEDATTQMTMTLLMDQRTEVTL